MRAVVITRPGGPEVLEEQQRPRPEPGPGEILVRVHAAALNRADLLQRRGGYAAPPGSPPDIPGLEYAGEVEAAGPEVRLWQRGDRVMGIVGGGGHGEFVVVHEREAIEIPEQLSWEEAAAVPEVFLTAYDALFARLELRVGERLLIHAVGSGVGTAALQLARAAGVRTLGTSRTEDKLQAAREMGLEVAVHTAAGDWVERVREATGGQGVDAVLDLVGGDYLAGDLRALRPLGRVVVVGTVAGRTTELDLGLLLARRARLVGTVLRARPLEEKIALARDFAAHVLPLLRAGAVRPVIDRVFSFPEIGDAHRYMESNQNFGKIVLTW